VQFGILPLLIWVFDNFCKSTLGFQPEYNLSIYGHTYSTGDDKENEFLFQRRAESIANFLISKGIASSRLIAKGLGASYPIASNDNARGRSKNRRIEIYLYKPIP